MSKRKTKILEYNVIFTAESEGGYSAYAPVCQDAILRVKLLKKPKLISKKQLSYI